VIPSSSSVYDKIRAGRKINPLEEIVYENGLQENFKSKEFNELLINLIEWCGDKEFIRNLKEGA